MLLGLHWGMNKLCACTMQPRASDEDATEQDMGCETKSLVPQTDTLRKHLGFRTPIRNALCNIPQ